MSRHCLYLAFSNHAFISSIGYIPTQKEAVVQPTCRPRGSSVPLPRKKKQSALSQSLMVMVAIAYYDLMLCLILELGQPHLQRCLEYSYPASPCHRGKSCRSMAICSLRLGTDPGSGVGFGPHLDDALLSSRFILAAPWSSSELKFLGYGRVPYIKSICMTIRYFFIKEPSIYRLLGQIESTTQE